MARKEKFETNYEPPKLKLAKKRERIRKTLDIIWAILMVASLFIIGIYQENDQIVGWGLIIMGIALNLPMAIFHIYIDLKGWEPLFYYDYWPSHLRAHHLHEREKDLEEHQTLRAITIFGLIGFTIVFPILGIIRLT